MTEPKHAPVVYCCGLAFNAARDRVVLIQKARPAWQRGKWNGVGGHVENWETPRDAMVREFEEETGVRVPSWQGFVVLTAVHCMWRCHFYRAFDVPTDEVYTKEDEPVAEWHIRSIYQGNLIPNLLWLIPLAIQEDVILSPPLQLVDIGPVRKP